MQSLKFRKGQMKSSIVQAMLGLFSRGGTPGMNTMRDTGRPVGNRALPQHLQEEMMATNLAKIQRKMARPGGWYSGRPYDRSRLKKAKKAEA